MSGYRRDDYCPTCGGGEPPPHEKGEKGEGDDENRVGEPEPYRGEGEGEGDGQGEPGEGDGDGGGDGQGEPGEGDGRGHNHSDGIYDGDPSCGGGSGSGGDPLEDELGDPSDVGDGGLSKEDADMIRGKIARDIRSQGKGVGNIPGGLYEWADQFLRPTLNWKRILGQQISKAVDRASGTKRASWSEVDRRSQPGRSRRVLKPGYYEPKLRVAIVLDTSGSMSGTDIAQALGEVEGILKSRSVSADSVTVLTTSTYVAEAKKVSKASQITAMDRGGTDMRIGIDAAEALSEKPDIVIVLTDGYTPWPDKRPKGMQVVAAIIGAEEGKRPAEVSEKFGIPKFISSVGIPVDENFQ